MKTQSEKFFLRGAYVMDKNKDTEKLNDDLLDKVSGGAGSPPSDVFPDDFDFDPFIRDNHILMQYEDARD